MSCTTSGTGHVTGVVLAEPRGAPGSNGIPGLPGWPCCLTDTAFCTSTLRRVPPSLGSGVTAAQNSPEGRQGHAGPPVWAGPSHPGSPDGRWGRGSRRPTPAGDSGARLGTAGPWCPGPGRAPGVRDGGRGVEGRCGEIAPQPRDRWQKLHREGDGCARHRWCWGCSHRTGRGERRNTAGCYRYSCTPGEGFAPK